MEKFFWLTSPFYGGWVLLAGVVASGGKWVRCGFFMGFWGFLWELG